MTKRRAGPTLPTTRMAPPMPTQLSASLPLPLPLSSLGATGKWRNSDTTPSTLASLDDGGPLEFAHLEHDDDDDGDGDGHGGHHDSDDDDAAFGARGPPVPVPPAASSELVLEASDSVNYKHEPSVHRHGHAGAVGAGAAGAVGGGHPFSSSRLQLFYQMSETTVETTLGLYRARARRLRTFADARYAANLRGRSTSSAMMARPRQRPSLDEDTDPDGPWKIVRAHEDLRVYRRPQRRHRRATTLLAQGVLRGTLHEVMDGLYAETTKELRVLCGLLSEQIVDAAVLHVDSYRTAQHPHQFSGVTWLALEASRGYSYGMCKDRDFVCFTKLGTFKDEAGGEIGYMTMQSLDQTEAASAHGLKMQRGTPLGPTKDFVRGYLSLAVFFTVLPNGLVAMFAHGDFHARGHLAARLADKMFADLLLGLGNAAKCGQAKNLAMLLQSMSAGQLPPGGVAGYGHVSRLLPLLSERHRDRCGVCSKTMWKMLEQPEFCRGCWTRTCRKCRVTLPIYCADFHRAHDEEPSGGGAGGGGGGGSGGEAPSSAAALTRKRRIPKPCKETFCLNCVCAVLPNGVKMNAKLTTQVAKGKKLAKRHQQAFPPAQPSPSILRRRVGGDPSATTVSKDDLGHGTTHVPSPSAALHLPRAPPPQVYVQLNRRHSSRVTHIVDDHSSISVLSSAESEKHQQHRLSLTKKTPTTGTGGNHHHHPLPPTLPPTARRQRPPSSMLEVLEQFQLSQMNTTITAAESSAEPQPDAASAAGDSYDSRSCTSSEATGHRLQLKVDLTPRKPRRKRHARTSAAVRMHALAGATGSLPPPSTPSPSPAAAGPVLDDEYYHRALQRYLGKRRSSLTSGSSTMSSELQALEREMMHLEKPPSTTRRPSAGRAVHRPHSYASPSVHPTTPSAMSISSFESSDSTVDRVCDKYLPGAPAF